MRRRLGDITLTGARRTVRRAVFTGQAVLAALALLAVMVEEHHLVAISSPDRGDFPPTMSCQRILSTADALPPQRSG